MQFKHNLWENWTRERVEKLFMPLTDDSSLLMLANSRWILKDIFMKKTKNIQIFYCSIQMDHVYYYTLSWRCISKLIPSEFDVKLWVIFFDFHIPLTLNSSCMPHHNFSWPIQTLTASHSRACLTERSSWTASSRRSSHETRACRCGGQVQSRPGWRLSWECPCTSEPARKTSKVARYTFGTSGSFAVCWPCAWEWGSIWAGVCTQVW